MDHSEFTLLNEYLDIVTDRASGSLMTTATWIRSFVTSHPAYNHDSVVNEKINYDLCRAVKNLDQGSVEYLRAPVPHN